MAGKREKPEDIVLKLRQVEVLQGQDKSVREAVRQIGVTGSTSDNDLLVVTHSVSQLDVVQIERDIERHLRSRWSNAGYKFAEKIVASVGGPVQLSGAKDERKTFATDRALMLAEDRITHKQGRSHLALRDV
jgi:hypothetical protein